MGRYKMGLGELGQQMASAQLPRASSDQTPKRGKAKSTDPLKSPFEKFCFHLGSRLPFYRKQVCQNVEYSQ